MTDTLSTVLAADAGMQEITSEAQLRYLLGEPASRVLAKERTALHEIDRKWLAASPFCLIATADADGNCDVSPKGDPPGFTYVLDDTRIAIPDRYGNKRADGFRNILSNPHVGTIFMVPGRKETLRINGRARLITKAPFFDEMIVKGHRPELALLIEIEQIFFHCQKALLRAGLWQPETWAPDALPSHARLMKSLPHCTEPLAELERYYGDAYSKGLYG